MTNFDHVLTVASDVLTALSAAGIDHVLGGALSFGYWGVPRGTADVDVTTFLRPEELEPVFRVLDGLGVQFDRARATDLAQRRGIFDVQVRGIRVDIYVPDIPLYESARARRRRVLFQGREVLIWAAEDIALFKLMYFRDKDKADVRAIVDVQREQLDVAYIRRWLHELVGAEDERTVWFDSLVSRV